ncbi:MAG: M50 family metallopeptidase, partial [Planctomycetota bacterium]
LLAVNGVAALGPTLGAAMQGLDAESDAPIELRCRRGDSELTVVVRPTPSTKPEPPRIGIVPLRRQVQGVRQGVPFVELLGLKRGDVLLAVDDQPFLSGDLDVVKQGPENLRLHIVRDGAEVLLERRATPSDRESLATSVVLTADDSLMLQPVPNTAAAAAGLRSGDRVESVDGNAMPSWQKMRRAIERAEEQPVTLVVRRLPPGPRQGFFDAERRDLPLGDKVELVVTPRREVVYEPGFVPKLEELREETRATSIGDALRLGTVCSLDLIKQLYVTLKRLVTGEVGTQNLGGIIRISQVSYDAAQRGPSWFWYFLALLSVNLAFVNLLPIPVLDGGHLLFLLIEKVKGSPVSNKVLGYSQVVGLVFVLLLVLFVTYNDIARFF